MEFDFDLFQNNIKEFFPQHFYFMDTEMYTSTIEEAELEIESEFSIKTNLINFSTEYKKKMACIGEGMDEDDEDIVDDRNARQLVNASEYSDDGMMKPGVECSDGYGVLKLAFQNYFDFQPVVGDKKEKEDYKRTLRLVDVEMKLLTGHVLLEKI